MKTYTFALTGEEHGSIVTNCANKQDAIKAFEKKYPNEKIILVKDISNHNLENL